MIVFEIKKKHKQPIPPPNIVHVREILRNRQNQRANELAVIDPHTRLPLALPATDEERKGELPWQPLGMGKEQYNKWMNAQVYAKFKKGDLVTTTDIAHILNTVPTKWYRVTDFQEVHFLAELDRDHRQPKAVGITAGWLWNKGTNMPVFFAPSKLRHLWQDELHALIVSNSEEKVNDSVRNPASSDAGKGPDVPVESGATPGYPGAGPEVDEDGS